MNWLVLGSGPLAPFSYGRLQTAERIDQVVTCNRGLCLNDKPDFYFLSDGVAIKLFLESSREAQAKGTKLVTLQRDAKSLKKRGLEHFDLFLPHNCQGWEQFRISGLTCLEFAAKRARKVFLVGMDGYKTDPKAPKYFETGPLPDDKLTSTEKIWQGLNHNVGGLTESIIRPVTQRLVEKYPEVEFVCYGDPNYKIEAVNWQIA